MSDECLCAGCGEPFTWRTGHPRHSLHPVCYHVKCFFARKHAY